MYYFFSYCLMLLKYIRLNKNTLLNINISDLGKHTTWSSTVDKQTHLNSQKLNYICMCSICTHTSTTIWAYTQWVRLTSNITNLENSNHQYVYNSDIDLITLWAQMRRNSRKKSTRLKRTINWKKTRKFLTVIYIHKQFPIKRPISISKLIYVNHTYIYIHIHVHFLE